MTRTSKMMTRKKEGECNEENGGDDEGKTMWKRGEMTNRRRRDDTTTTIEQSRLRLCSFHFFHVPRHNPKGGLLPWE